jgi:hypothetical protein
MVHIHRSNRIESINCSYKFNKYKLLNKYKLNKYKLNIDGISSTTTATAAIATINYKTSAEGISNEDAEDAKADAGLLNWFTDQIESNRRNNNNRSNSTSTTDTTTPATATINYKTSAEGISDEDGEAGLLEGSTERIESNRCNSISNNSNNGSNSTSTTDTTTPATATINYKTSAEGISDEDGEAGLSEGSTERIESNRCNSISNNSNNGSISTSTSTTPTNKEDDFHISIMFKLITLYLIITKSISPKEFIRNPKSKHHHHQ